MSEGITRPGYLYYYDDLPAWTIRVPQPSRFKSVPITIEPSAFELPMGGLVACIVRFYDIPDQPFYVHRVFDVSDADVAQYLSKTKECLQWVIELKGGGEDRDIFRILRLQNTGLLECCEAALRHNQSLGSRLDGSGALKRFLDLFEPSAKEGGWEAGWNAVRREFESPA